MPEDNAYLKLAAPGIAGLAPYVPGKPASEIERVYGVHHALKLASNENPMGPAPAARAAVAGATALELYPDGASFELRNRLAQHLAVRPEQLTLGNGSNEILVMLAETFLTPAHNAVIDQYSFVVYRLAIQACGAEPRFAPAFPPDHESPLGHDLEAFSAAVDEHTRLVFIANPNNPTGSYIPQDKVLAFLRAMPSHVIVVLDEAYLEYALESEEADTTSWLEQFPNLVIVRTFSKAYGLAALRVGYAVSHPDLAELLNRVRQPFNVNSLAQAAARAALDDQAWIAAAVADNVTQRRCLADGLAELGWRSLPSRGNFLLVDFTAQDTAAAVNEFLLRQGVIVRPVTNYGLAPYLRITVGADWQVKRLLAALDRFAG
ncbi:MAG: histidinol-phosphate transaminase [Gammaproteobacteria bacterium]|jgi:histidinol-phosphate aminotransferase|nr:histidinol-phosphate transaminase [Gammaproteobacteria bacterium]